MVLGHETHAAKNPLLRLQAGDVLALEKHLPLLQVEHPEHRLHRGRLAGPVRPHNNGNLAGIDTDGAAVKDIRAAIAANHVLADKETHDAAPAFGRFFSPVPR